MANKEYTPVQAIREFFGLKPGQTLQDFLAEMRELSSDEKRELATLAADAMGGTVKG